jgi:hypothetical protein
MNFSRRIFLEKSLHPPDATMHSSNRNETQLQSNPAMRVASRKILCARTSQMEGGRKSSGESRAASALANEPLPVFCQVMENWLHRKWVTEPIADARGNARAAEVIESGWGPLPVSLNHNLTLTLNLLGVGIKIMIKIKSEKITLIINRV